MGCCLNGFCQLPLSQDKQGNNSIKERGWGNKTCEKGRGFFNAASLSRMQLQCPSPFFLSHAQTLGTTEACSMRAKKEIKTSRGQGVMFNFNLFAVIVQTCSTMFCKLPEKKTKKTNTLSQINYDSTIPDQFPESNLWGFKIRLLSMHTNCRRLGINMWFQIFLMQLATAVIFYFLFFLTLLRLKARSFLIKLITLRRADSEAN